MLTTRFVTGSVNWTDLTTPGIEGANTFYGELFGWRFQPGSPEFGGYGTYELDGKAVAGGMPLAEEMGPPRWGIFFQSPDADATAKAVAQAGGTVVAEPMDVADLGRMAVFTDQAGAEFGVWQPGTMPGLEAVNTAGSLCWAELYTTDVAAAVGFYGAVLGLQAFEVTFPGGSYTTVYPEGTTADDMFGGIVAKESDPVEAAGEAYWLPYFAVDDCDATVATAERLGGTVRMEPTDMEDVGRLAKLADPHGLRFALLKPVPPQG
ncbi:VOC family protein [Streptomyces sp. E11-3]|uniref:VOC family protein n=1 Tax=Streptomyces sp. E11-3 TaxID=3110112 RepID=UPI0039811070